MVQREDILWKGVLEEVFDDFLRFFYLPQTVSDNVFDLSRGVVFLDKELAQLSPQVKDETKEKGLSTKIVDKLVKIYTHNGEEKWILLHLEIQGTFRKDFAFRMFTYYYKILDKYQRPVAACAILTEAVLKPRTGIYEQEIMGTSIRYQFKICKIAEQDDAALWASDNLFALVVLIAKSKFIGKNIKDPDERDKALLTFKCELLQVLDSRSIPERKANALLKFLVHYVQFETIEYSKIFNNKIQNNRTMTSDDYFKLYVRLQGRDEGRKEGRKEGKKEGRQLAKTEDIRRLLTLTDFSGEKIAELVNMPISFVQKIHEELQKETKEAYHEAGK